MNFGWSYAACCYCGVRQFVRECFPSNLGIRYERWADFDAIAVAPVASDGRSQSTID
jgi:hypothetical protein